MDYAKEFFVTYFPLLIIYVTMMVMVIKDFKSKRRIAVLNLLIINATLLLAILTYFEEFSKDSRWMFVATLCGCLGYMLRPAVLTLFILLAEKEQKKYKIYYFIPLILNTIVFILPLFIGTPVADAIYHLNYNGEDLPLTFGGGDLSLYYTCHIISLLLLVALLFFFFKKIRRRHLFDGMGIIACVVFVLVATLIEWRTTRVGLLNNAIMVSSIVNYLFMFNQATQVDPLTDLFNRSSFYIDENNFSKNVKAIIQIDMNGLKKINDEIGHEEGDKALAAIGKVISSSVTKEMYAYRLGGDEFVILSLTGKEATITKTIAKMREKLSETPYSASIGYALKSEECRSFIDMMKKAEVEMYKDKDNYYKITGIDRRRAV